MWEQGRYMCATHSRRVLSPSHGVMPGTLGVPNSPAEWKLFFNHNSAVNIILKKIKLLTRRCIHCNTVCRYGNIKQLDLHVACNQLFWARGKDIYIYRSMYII